MIQPSLTTVFWTALALASVVTILLVLDLRAAHRECPWWVRLAAWLQLHDRARPIYDLHHPSELYLERFYLLGDSESRFALVLHRFHRGDNDRHLHDHPWPFITWILAGGYWEERLSGWRFLSPGKVLLRTATLLHRVALDPRAGEVWTLVLMGPRYREWGFKTESGWMHQQDYKRWVREERAAEKTSVIFCLPEQQEAAARIIAFPDLRDDDATPSLGAAAHDSPEIVLRPGWTDADEERYQNGKRPS